MRGILDGSRANPFLVDFHPFVGSLARPGAITSLAQFVLKLAVPGIPDIYQGGELWDFNLVDPDNRRPVDWERCRTLLSKTGAAGFAELGSDWRDGREKLFVTHRLVQLRWHHPELFAAGDYLPLGAIGGQHGDHHCAFGRRHAKQCL
jgi:(1->4)-alpha-D-glucan 1-alpha-D-glucosylmutase